MKGRGTPSLSLILHVDDSQFCHLYIAVNLREMTSVGS